MCRGAPTVPVAAPAAEGVPLVAEDGLEECLDLWLALMGQEGSPSSSDGEPGMMPASANEICLFTPPSLSPPCEGVVMELTAQPGEPAGDPAPAQPQPAPRQAAAKRGSRASRAERVEAVKQRRRESAKRSRDRRNCYQHQLEEENAALKAQVALLQDAIQLVQCAAATCSSVMCM